MLIDYTFSDSARMGHVGYFWCACEPGSLSGLMALPIAPVREQSRGRETVSRENSLKRKIEGTDAGCLSLYIRRPCLLRFRGCRGFRRATARMIKKRAATRPPLRTKYGLRQSVSRLATVAAILGFCILRLPPSENPLAVNNQNQRDCDGDTGKHVQDGVLLDQDC